MAQVDIVMPLYNKASTVARAIRSIQHQTLKDWHLIVVDDGSTDEGPEIVSGIEDERIEMIRQENRGPGAARNVGIARAQSEYLSFLDADDEWYPWFLENSLSAIKESDVGLVASMYYLWPQGQDMTEFWAARNVRLGRHCLKGDEDPIWVEKFRGVLMVWNVMMPTKVARKYEGFYEKNHCLSGEDTTFFLRVLFGEELMLIGPAAVRYHLEDSKLGFYGPSPGAVAPFLDDPDAVLRYCPPTKRALMMKVLDRMAVASARRLARKGLKDRAVDLLARYPGAKCYQWEHYRCRYEIALSRWFPYWVKFKCAVGVPTRAFLRSLSARSQPQPQPPAMPYEQEADKLDEEHGHE